MRAEEELLDMLKEAGINPMLTLPCGKAKHFFSLIGTDEYFQEIQLTREEEAVGIAAGAYMAGKMPAIAVQSSGVGNMVNAIASLTKAYELPLLLLLSLRGHYGEKIPAQMPMGLYIERILGTMGIKVFQLVRSPKSQWKSKDNIGRLIVIFYEKRYNAKTSFFNYLAPHRYNGSRAVILAPNLTL